MYNTTKALDLGRYKYIFKVANMFLLIFFKCDTDLMMMVLPY